MDAIELEPAPLKIYWQRHKLLLIPDEPFKFGEATFNEVFI